MDHLVYTAASGSSDAMLAQAVNASNLANASTTGFRADLLSASSAYMTGDAMESRTYATANKMGIDFKQGTINATGRDLDVAISGEGWLTVVGADGTEAIEPSRRPARHRARTAGRRCRQPGCWQCRPDRGAALLRDHHW